MRQVSYDLTLAEPLELADGDHGHRAGGPVGAVRPGPQVRRGARARGRRRRDGRTAGARSTGSTSSPASRAIPSSLADRVDWIAKQRLLEGYRERHDLDWGDPRLAALALQYHDLRPERSLAARAGLVRLTDDDEVERAMTEPPEDTRAYFRGQCLRRWADQIVAANWDSLVFDVGQDPLRRVPMMEPLRGTRAHVGTLLDECATPAELLAKLSA